MHLRGAGRGGGNAPYTFLLRIKCKKRGGGGVQIACKFAFVINGRPLIIVVGGTVYLLSQLILFSNIILSNFNYIVQGEQLYNYNIVAPHSVWGITQDYIISCLYMYTCITQFDNFLSNTFIQILNMGQFIK